MDASTAETLTAVGTVIAAVGTVGALGFAAWAAKSASESADAANAAVAGEMRPLLLDVPRELYTDGEHEMPWPDQHEFGVVKSPMRGEIRINPATGTFAVPVRNVGRGVARIEHFEMGLARGEDEPWRVSPTSAAIPVGEEQWLATRPSRPSAFLTALEETPSPLHDFAPLVFSVTYTDAALKQRQRLELQLGASGQDTAWRVIQSAHVNLDRL